MDSSGLRVDDLLIEIKLRRLLLSLKLPHRNPEPDIFLPVFHGIDSELMGLLPAFRKLHGDLLFLTQKTGRPPQSGSVPLPFPRSQASPKSHGRPDGPPFCPGGPVSFYNIGIFFSEQEPFPFRSQHLCQHLKPPPHWGTVFPIPPGPRVPFSGYIPRSKVSDSGCSRGRPFRGKPSSVSGNGSPRLLKQCKLHQVCSRSLWFGTHSGRLHFRSWAQ